jgi:hypothetical protein
MTKTRIEEIYEFVLPLLNDNGFDDTPANRLYALMGVWNAWTEDESTEIEKTFYMLALSSEIFRLKVELMFPRIMGTQKVGA